MADSSCPEHVGRLVSLQGTAEVRRTGEVEWQTVNLEDTFCFGDTIRVLEDSRAAVQLQNDALLRLDQKTTLTFSDIQNERTYIIDLLKGAVHFFSRGSRSLKVVTPYVNAAVEGTEFEVRVTDDEAKVTLMEGRVLLENDQGEVTLAKGQVGVARAGGAPTSYLTVSPRDAVKWALYYPRVVLIPPDEISALSDSRRLVYRAGEKLSLGQVDAAEEDIDTALFLDPENGDAISLKAVIAVVNNQKDESLSLAEAAVTASPEAASARLARSYARQAAFDLKGALAALETAVELESDNALAWARLSELRLSLEDVSGAFIAAQRATALQPDLSHIQTVLGYAYLEQVKLDAAQEAFEVAISLDSSAPLPQLGLGLTKIRQGDLTEGRRFIEVAAGLDPINSVFRSYLGKAYFEEKRDAFSAEQFAIAKELDPMDPTPWLYDAMRKQSINQPVEALYDIYQSIKLNDNRAVYRSRLQLDQDLAVRSTSLARIYNDLGFQQLGLSEGRKSLGIDPGNYSAHRLMADSYSVLPRHEIARVSELLQSQLLQPINTTPITAGLSKTSLTLMESSLLGSTQLPTDFSMMTRNDIRLQATGLAGFNDLYGGDVVVSGIQDRFSFFAGYNYFSTDGFRENNDQTEELANMFTQVQLTSKTSLQVEYRHEDVESGDVNVLFDSTDYLPNFRENEIGDMFRVGLHHQFEPSADFLLSGVYEDLEYNGSNLYAFPGGVATGFEIASEEEFMLFEAQQTFRSSNLYASLGAGYFEFTIDHLQSIFFSFLPMPSVDINSVAGNQDNIYLYAHTSFPDNVTWTFGGDYSRYDDGETDGEQFSPKFGAVWQVTGKTSMHAAVFRTLMRMLPQTKQTIEPTHVAGFNQFFDDPYGTDTWLYGIGLDYTFSPSLYGGLEYFKRDIEFPFMLPYQSSPVSVPVFIKQTSSWLEQTSRAYIYWAPNDRLTASMEVFHENYDRDTTFGNPSGISKTDIYRVPLSVRFFHPVGIIAGVKGTYFKQDGMFGEPETGFIPGDDRFWVIDASLGYRMPKRLGVFTLEMRNLFNETFSFQDTDPANPATVSDRMILGRIEISY
jgi:tetratricopeptide (TPR) repeat protein